MFKKIQTGFRKKKTNNKKNQTPNPTVFWIYVFFWCVCHAVTNQISSLVPSSDGLLSFYLCFSLFSLPSTNTLVPMSQLQLPLRKERAGKCDQPWRFSRVRVLLSPLLCSKHIWHWLCSLPSPAPQHGFNTLCRSLTAFHTHLLTSDRQQEKKEKQHWAMKVKDKFKTAKDRDLHLPSAGQSVPPNLHLLSFSFPSQGRKALLD